MEQTRLVAYLTAPETISYARTAMPELRPDSALIQIKAVGICGSDIAYYRTGRTGVGEIHFPHILGHECAGVVAAVGRGVTRLHVGDRVAVEPGYSCGHCSACLSGRYNLCREMSFMGSAVAADYGEGAFAEYTLRPEKLLFRLPENANFADGAMLEPLSVGLHAARRASLRAGDRAIILGCGPIAACVLMALRAMGVYDVCMTDILPDRLARMKSLGATAAVNVGDLDADALKKLYAGTDFDAAFDTTCNEQAINACLHWIKKGGAYVQIGVPSGKFLLDMQTIFNRGISVLPSFRYANTYPAVIELLKHGVVSSGPLITHRFSFGQAGRAMDLAASRAPGIMKVLLEL